MVAKLTIEDYSIASSTDRPALADPLIIQFQLT
jgi:hypothetical protein